MVDAAPNTNHADDGAHALALQGSSAAAVNNNFGGFAMLSVTIVAVIFLGISAFISGYALSQVSAMKETVQRVEKSRQDEVHSQETWNLLTWTAATKTNATLVALGVDKKKLGEPPPPPKR